MKKEEQIVNPHMKSTVIQESLSGGNIGSLRDWQIKQQDAIAKNIQGCITGENKRKKNYYSVGGIEVKDVQKAKMPKQLTGMQGAYWFNVVKYVLRCGWKGTLLKDLKKAQDYLNWLIEDIENDSKMGGDGST